MRSRGVEEIKGKHVRYKDNNSKDKGAVHIASYESEEGGLYYDGRIIPGGDYGPSTTSAGSVTKYLNRLYPSPSPHSGHHHPVDMVMPGDLGLAGVTAGEVSKRKGSRLDEIIITLNHHRELSNTLSLELWAQ